MLIGREPWVLAVDIGTSSTKAIVFDGAGAPVAGLRAHEPYRMRVDASGASEMDADALLDAAARCIDRTLELAGAHAARIRAVGVCTLWHSTIGLGHDGEPITPLYSWADTRSAQAALTLREKLEADAVHANTGCALHPSYLPARLAWLRAAEPELFGRATWWVSPGELLFWRLFGTRGCSISMASGTGLVNQHTRHWEPAVLDAVGIGPDRLFPLTDVDRPSAGLAPVWAERWPALAGIPWVPAVGDGAASNLGSDCTDETRIAINLGTSGAIRVLWSADDAAIPPDLWCYRLTDEQAVMGAAFSDGGQDFAWLQETLQLPDAAAVEQALGERQPGEHGLVFVPFLSGERSFGWRPGMRASLHGLTMATRPLDIVQAVMEGIALRFARAADMLRRQFPRVGEVVASGGALAESPAWARMVADAIGVPLTLSPVSEASSRGAALLALRAAGASAPPVPSTDGEARIVTPDRRRHAIFLKMAEEQEELANY